MHPRKATHQENGRKGGRPRDPNKMKPVFVKLPPALVAQLDEYVESTDTDRSACIREMVSAFFSAKTTIPKK